MNVFTRLVTLVRQVWRKLIPYKDIETVTHIDTPLSSEMTTALDDWYNIYLNRAAWLKPDSVKSLNLAAFICSEIARQVVLELKWNISGTEKNGDNESVSNPRSEYLSKEFEKVIQTLRQKLEQGCAAGGMAIRPYTKDGRIFFEWTMDWSLFPVAFDDEGNLSDVIFRDTYTEGKTVYTRLERHRREGDDVHITQRAFKSQMRDNLGVEIPLTDVSAWEKLEPEAIIKDAGGHMFGWFKVAAANSVDPESPMGASVFAKAVDVIKEADIQYSRLLWEYEASEMAIDVDPTVLRPKKMKDANGKTVEEMPQLNERLFRKVDLGKDDNYNVFAPPIRDASLSNGLNGIFKRIEDLCGLARGTLSDVNAEARTATELRIVKQRSYATIADNQQALERCLRDVIRAMDKWATLYDLAPEGEYEVSFEWDDSVITDSEQQMNERLMLLNSGITSKAEFREWYFGETPAQAKEAIERITEEQVEQATQMMPALPTE